MMLHLDSMEHDLANKGVWVTTRFLLLTSELCVVAFGSAFGVREDRVSVSGRWSTFSIASISSVTRSAFKGSRWFVRQSPSWSALSRLTLKSFSHFTGSRFIAFLQYLYWTLIFFVGQEWFRSIWARGSNISGYNFQSVGI